MLAPKTQYDLKNAREYFEEHLCVGDYYDEGQRVSGEWTGIGAEKLDLRGRIRADDFLRLCANQHPLTGETLTQRLNSTRSSDGRIAANRRIFFDFTFSPPKSVSVLGLLAGDSRIVEAHARAVRIAARELEAFGATRVRKDGASEHRLTGNFVSALFTHDTSRALDPHLHTHCIVFNATYDPIENRWKALENYEMLRARKFAENVYYHELCRELRRFGYSIRNRARGDFEVDGIPEELCHRFSKRDAEIDAALKKLLTEKPELANSNIPELRARLALENRARKQKNINRDELRLLWNAQLNSSERDALNRMVLGTEIQPSAKITISEAIEWAEDHLFDRNAVVRESQLWQHALERGRGEDFSIAELKRQTARNNYVRNSQRLLGELTRPDVLQRETEIVRTVREGIAACHPLVWESKAPTLPLDDEQRKVLDTLLSSTDRIAVFRGGAGTGKSFVLREVANQAIAAGRQIVVIAPQRQQVLDLERASLPAPKTVAQFLAKPELPAGALVIVDESGQIGGRQMLAMLRLIRDQNARMILSGDTRQHGPVEASDALLAIERYSEIKPVELRKIRRQDPERARNRAERRRIEEYRKAVAAAADGKNTESFKRLEQIQAIVSCGVGEQAGKLADEYVRLTETGASAVVVSQTWSEVNRVNAEVRTGLKAKGIIGLDDTLVPILEKIDLTNAQKRDARSYSPETLVVFNQKVRSAEPGAKGKLMGILKSSVLVEVDGTIVPVSNKHLDRISVCTERQILVAAGDRLHLKANRRLRSGHRANNGELVTVEAVKPTGEIELTDGRILDRSFQEFLPGYAVTSYGSQGKTVDYVLFSDSLVKAATNSQQWYVTISRGRRGIRIFTPDKEQLRENICRSGDRPLALELIQGTSLWRNTPVWNRLHRYLVRFGQRAADNIIRLKIIRSRRAMEAFKHEHKNTRIVAG
jgi:conjugative relaxase-like TrwC/TraI family protein